MLFQIDNGFISKFWLGDDGSGAAATASIGDGASAW